MLTEIIVDRFNKEIRLTRERWDYIVSKRPILGGYKKQFINTIQEPELIISDRIKEGEVIWRKD
jgi:hypothetical protein